MTPMAKRKPYRQLVAEEDAAYDALNAVDPEASDEVIAALIADHAVKQLPSSRLIHLSIMHEIRPREIQRIERAIERDSKAGHDPFGPCPLPFDWQSRNTVGISTRDPERARQWAFDAMLAGYAVYRQGRRNGSGGGMGTIAHVRDRRRDEIARLSRERGFMIE
jgi:hypothetical protein